jgi:hypothetical protein
MLPSMLSGDIYLNLPRSGRPLGIEANSLVRTGCFTWCILLNFLLSALNASPINFTTVGAIAGADITVDETTTYQVKYIPSIRLKPNSTSCSQWMGLGPLLVSLPIPLLHLPSINIYCAADSSAKLFAALKASSRPFVTAQSMNL